MPKIKQNTKDGGQADLTRSAYEAIRQLMFHHEIVPGQKISYRDLSERLGMSVTPIIHALKYLEFQNLVRHEPNRGYYTEPIDIREVTEIYLTRELIEVSLLPEAIARCDKKTVLNLQSAYKSYCAAALKKSFNHRLIQHKEFHLTLAELSGCQIRIQILRFLFDLLYLKFGGSIAFGHYMRQKTSLEDNLTLHKEILDSVVSCNIDKAQSLLKKDIVDTREQVLSELRQYIADKNTAVF